MITNYLLAAMERAHYEVLPDGTYYGEIPCLQGVWACNETLETCQNELRDVLECWLVLGLRLGHDFPSLDGCDFTIKEEKC